MERTAGETSPDPLNADGEAVCSDITLRDLFAAFCAAGMVVRDGGDCGMQLQVAKLAYRHADALLAQRQQREED